MFEKKFRSFNGHKKVLLQAAGFTSIKDAKKQNPTATEKQIYEGLLEDYNNQVDEIQQQIKDIKKQQIKEEAKQARQAKNIAYERVVIINKDTIETEDRQGINRLINRIELNTMKRKFKNNKTPMLFQQQIQLFNNKGKEVDKMEFKFYIDTLVDGLELIDTKKFVANTFEINNITKEFIGKIEMYMMPVYDGDWYPDLVVFKNGGSVKITTRALKNIKSKPTKQTYKDADTGTCVYDGVVKFFERNMEKNKNAKSIYNNLIKNKETYAKSYTDEEIENELAPICKASFTIKNLINGKDKKLNENTFNRFNIELMNTKYNHLDLLAHNYNDVEEVSKEQYNKLKKSLPFYIEKYGKLISLDKTYKQTETKFQEVYKNWKQICKDIYEADYDTLFIYKDTDEYRMLQRYDYKLHTFFNDFELNNSMYTEYDLKKAYYNYSNHSFNRFYRGVPSGSFLNFTCNKDFDFKTITKNGLVGFYEIKIINSKLDNRLGFTNNSIHYLFTSMIELLLEHNVEIEFLNASYSPSVHIPFHKECLEKENNLKHYCKIFGLMLSENSIIDIKVKPLKCDVKYFDTINDENLYMFKDNDIVKLQYQNKKVKSYIHIGYTLHAYTQTLILEQLINMDLNYVFGVKLDSIVIKNDYKYEFNNNFDKKECKIEGLLKRSKKEENEEYIIDGKTYILNYEEEEEILEEDEFNNTGYYRNYIVSSYTKNLNFKLPFTQEHIYIINRIVFIGGPGGSGKTYSLLNNLNTTCYTTMCWNLIQGKMKEYKIVNGHSIPQLTGGSEEFKCEKTTDKNIKYIIIDEATLLNKLDIIHIMANYPNCFIFILGDIDYDGTYYQASVTKQVFNPSVDNKYEEEIYDKNGELKSIKQYNYNIQYMQYLKTFRFDENLNNKLNILRNVMKAKYENNYVKINNIMNCVKKEFANNFMQIEDVVYNDNDVGICSRDDTKRNNELTNYFIEKGTKPKYFIKKTIKEKNQMRGQELLEIPEHNNYECKLFKTIHSFQGLDLSHDNKIIIIIDSLFDENLLYTALSRARRQDQIVIVDKREIKPKENKLCSCGKTCEKSYYYLCKDCFYNSV